ncbi:Pam17-domain-containing protein [Glonium stellatum]|uniref:Presequence translocated-associated motor subunit PAM17 n=1 Tax=Glonium stellatum TaxID=574774 RepID=A0A8E2JPN4_9PEZI|nr:Pam17-domain-containing protein [Glonium stellatum]
MLSTTNLRSTRALTYRFQPALLTPCAASPCSTASRPTKTPRSPAHSAPRPSVLHKPSVRIPSRASARLASTSASAAAAVPSSSNNNPSSASEQPLTWNRFLALRKTRRRISLVSSILSAGGCTAVGAMVLMQRDLDSIGAQTLGLDPMIVLGLSTMGFAAVGWLVGPFFGNAVFNLVYRNVRGQIDAKERAFYARIKKYRVDPTSSSMANPVPDYYGEKIGSVADYRRWLKDQRAFNLKRGRMI